MNDRNQRNTAPRKLPPSSLGVHPEYIIHTGVPRRGASSSLGQEVAHSGTDMALEEEKRAREEPHDQPCNTVLHHERRSASYGCIYRDHHGIFLLIARFRWTRLFGSSSRMMRQTPRVYVVSYGVFGKKKKTL